MSPSSSPTPHQLFGFFAAAEMVTWAGLIAAIISRAIGLADFVSLAGGLHGFIFLSYATVTVFVWVNQKWKPALGIMGVLLAIVPFATVPYEIFLKKRGLLDGGWRLAPGGQAPRTLVEKVQAWVLRNPLLAIILLLAFVVALYLTLLWLGPPIPKN